MENVGKTSQKNQKVKCVAGKSFDGNLIIGKMKIISKESKFLPRFGVFMCFKVHMVILIILSCLILF